MQLSSECRREDRVLALRRAALPFLLLILFLALQRAPLVEQAPEEPGRVLAPESAPTGARLGAGALP